MMYTRPGLAALIASAALGGAPPANAQSGGYGAPQTPTVQSVACGGADGATCRRGSLLTVRGTGLREARQIVFLGRRGSRDDRHATPRSTTDETLAVTVPAGARSGRISVLGALKGSRALGPRLIVDPRRLPESVDSVAGTVFLDGAPASFSYRLTAPDGNARVELYSPMAGATLQTWPATVESDGTGVVRWNGRIGGDDAPEGIYAFRLSGAATAASATAADQFELLDHMFPIRGKHDLGQSQTNGFGGGRGHQGQDMFARCGTPVAAARGGVVTEAKFDARGGNYAVITDRAGRSNVYMHLRDPALVRRGDRVLTGVRIGYVGDTGHAEGCHLHFEIWTAPGWYQGGHAIDPLPELRRWDERS